MSKPLEHQVLARAREFISDRKHWAQMYMAKSGIYPVEPWDRNVETMCAVGAVHRAVHEFNPMHTESRHVPLFEAAIEVLATAVNPRWREDRARAIDRYPAAAGLDGFEIAKRAWAQCTVSNFNDWPETTHAKVLAAFERALK